MPLYSLHQYGTHVALFEKVLQIFLFICPEQIFSSEGSATFSIIQKIKHVFDVARGVNVSFESNQSRRL